MFKNIGCLLIVGMCCSCNANKDKVGLKEELSDLKKAMEINHDAVAMLMDSIDANRRAFTEVKVEGSSFRDFALRVQDINQYIREAQNRIVFLENKLKSVNATDTDFRISIGKLRHDLEIKKYELSLIQKQVAKYQNQSDNLSQTVDLQRASLDEKIDQLELKSAETDTLLRKTKVIVADAKVIEAESYFAQARAVEEAANRTRLAPRKKRITRMEAIELYRKAAVCGKEGAQAKVAELLKKI